MSCSFKLNVMSSYLSLGRPFFLGIGSYLQRLRSKVALRIRQKHNRQGTNKPTKLNTAKLSTISHRESFEQEMDSALAQMGGEGKLNTRRGMGSPAAGRV